MDRTATAEPEEDKEEAAAIREVVSIAGVRLAERALDRVTGELLRRRMKKHGRSGAAVRARSAATRFGLPRGRVPR